MLHFFKKQCTFLVISQMLQVMAEGLDKKVCLRTPMNISYCLEVLSYSCDKFLTLADNFTTGETITLSTEHFPLVQVGQLVAGNFSLTCEQGRIDKSLSESIFETANTLSAECSSQQQQSSQALLLSLYGGVLFASLFLVSIMITFSRNNRISLGLLQGDGLGDNEAMTPLKQLNSDGDSGITPEQ